jgi:predicted secreted protein
MQFMCDRFFGEGGTIEQVAADGAYAIAFDGTHVYVADNDGCIVWRIAKTGGKVQILAENQNYSFDIAVDDKTVYWSRESGATVFIAESHCIGKAGHGKWDHNQ